MEEGNSTQKFASGPTMYNISSEDSNWIMTSAFIIFTMQTGFGLLESGCVSTKNEVNIMMKNVVDIFLGGFTYWLFGFGFQFGYGPFTTPLIGMGSFALDVDRDDSTMGAIYTAFIFQLSFATTATTIVSGAMAERCNFKAYCLFSILNTVIYAVPAGWVWGQHGFLANLGAVDIAGSGCVHLVGGVSALASAMMLGPRLGRYTYGIEALPLGTPVNCAMGLFVLWWGWLAFNSGRYATVVQMSDNTYGVSGKKWEYAAKAAVMTILSSFGGGCVGLFYTLFANKGQVLIMDLINSVLGSLVAVTAGCFLYSAWESILIGAIGGILACVTMPWFDKFAIDDPVGASSVHGICGIWGVLAVGFFASDPKPLNTTNGKTGLFKGGEWYLLGVQAITCLCLTLWSFLTTVFILWLVNLVVPIRLTVYEELLGADLVEHQISHPGDSVDQAIRKLAPIHPEIYSIHMTQKIGSNPGHEAFLHQYVQRRMKELRNPSTPGLFSIRLNEIQEEKANIIPYLAWMD